MSDPLSDADAKGLAAALNDNSGIAGIAFSRGVAAEITYMPILCTAQRIVVVVACPPTWARTATLNAFSARATASITGRCPLCAAVASTRADEHGYAQQTFVHDVSCLADDEMLRALLVADQMRDQVARAPRNAPCPCNCGVKAKHCRRMQP